MQTSGASPTSCDRSNDLVERARGKQLKPDDVQGGTFTLNNTGSTGSVASQPIINQPQAAIRHRIHRQAPCGDRRWNRRQGMMNMCRASTTVSSMDDAGQFLGTIRSASKDGRPQASNCDHWHPPDTRTIPPWIACE